MLLCLLVLVNQPQSVDSCTLAVASISVSAILMTSIVGLVSLAIGFKCGSTSMKKKQMALQEARNHIEMPVYEEVQFITMEQPNKMKVNPNIAYQEVAEATKTSK